MEFSIHSQALGHYQKNKLLTDFGPKCFCLCHLPVHLLGNAYHYVVNKCNEKAVMISPYIPW